MCLCSCDFSMSRILSSQIRDRCNNVDSVDADTWCGTPGFISPEELLGEAITVQSDVYSFAMILWELLTSSTPFKEYLHGPGISPSLAKLRCIEICTNDRRPDLPTNFRFFAVQPSLYADITGLIEECWRRDPGQRPRFGSIAKRLATFHKKISAQSNSTPLKQNPG